MHDRISRITTLQDLPVSGRPANHEGRVGQVENRSSNIIDVAAAAGTSSVGKAAAAGVEQSAPVPTDNQFCHQRFT